MKKTAIQISCFRVLFLLLLLFYAQAAISRPVRLIYSGGTIPLYVTSLTQYENGIELANWTKIRIVIDTTNHKLPVGVYTKWRLTIYAGDNSIISDDGNPNLSLDYLKLRFVGFSANPEGYHSFPNETEPYSLSNSEKIFVEGTKLDGFEAEFGITYQFGVTDQSPSLMNLPWGFYYTQLHIKLELY
ncbi:MAG: hypothetical protein RBR68_14600 [Tenuifilaceae bacterium]|nr:hypothetical protein [Tenuifilaceae bacterium]